MDGMKINLSPNNFRRRFAGVSKRLRNCSEVWSICAGRHMTNLARNLTMCRRTLDVDRNNDGKRDIWGKYTVAGDSTQFKKPPDNLIPKDRRGPGVYMFS
jgi:hypothetical protein